MSAYLKCNSWAGVMVKIQPYKIEIPHESTLKIAALLKYRKWLVSNWLKACRTSFWIHCTWKTFKYFDQKWKKTVKCTFDHVPLPLADMQCGEAWLWFLPAMESSSESQQEPEKTLVSRCAIVCISPEITGHLHIYCG